MHIKSFFSVLSAVALLAIPAFAAPEIGKPAPTFKAVDAHGKPFDLASYKGKTVILEWTNHECPFVRKHYDSGNMQQLQKDTHIDGVKWISIISSAVGRQGHVSDAEALKIAADNGATPTTIIRDESGAIGHLYDAKTTPHMFIIDKTGILVYAGAIDDNSSPRASTIEGATNYVRAALNDIEAGNPVAVPSSQPYGCGVKYK